VFHREAHVSTTAPWHDALSVFVSGRDFSRVGAEVDEPGAFQAAVQLAEKSRMPVWIAPSSSRYPFPTTHPLFRGVLPFAIGRLAEKLTGHDLILVFGAPVFRYHEYLPGAYLPEGAQLVAVSSDPAEAARGVSTFRSQAPWASAFPPQWACNSPSPADQSSA
jgi:hypothetical protein